MNFKDMKPGPAKAVAEREMRELMNDVELVSRGFIALREREYFLESLSRLMRKRGIFPRPKKVNWVLDDPNREDYSQDSVID
jgi:hypothetical protein